MRQIHRLSGTIIFAFAVLHLGNHLASIGGIGQHQEIMATLRLCYRHWLGEGLLLGAVALQIGSGSALFYPLRKAKNTFPGSVQRWTGLYLAFFLLIHVSAVLAGRLFLHLDTNFYFGAAGLNSFPANLFFIPYYSLAIVAFFGHFPAIFRPKNRQNWLGLPPANQAKWCLAIGGVVALLIWYGFTNGFKGVEIPASYHTLTTK